MSVGPLDDETVKKYREAGEILRTVLGELAGMVGPDVTHLEVAEHAETRIRGLADDCAFPVNISINGEASHASPGRDDDTVFGEDMIYLDISVHVNDYIADSAVTVDLSGNDEPIESTEETLNAVLDMVETGMHTGKIDAGIEDVIRGYGYTPVLSLSGHGVKQWDAHTDLTIPNRDVERNVELEVGDVAAIKSLATDSTGGITERSKNEIYNLISDCSVHDRMSRKLLDEMRKEYKLLPFAARWFEDGRSEMTIRRLEQQGILRGYPVLKEEDDTMVGQAEDAIVVTEDGYEDLTR